MFVCSALNGDGSRGISGGHAIVRRILAGDADITVTGYGTKKEFPDGWLQYSGFHGSADVSGTRIVVILAGVGIDLSAQGRGRVILWGHGSYDINGQSGEWSMNPLSAHMSLASTGVK